VDTTARGGTSSSKPDNTTNVSNAQKWQTFNMLLKPVTEVLTLLLLHLLLETTMFHQLDADYCRDPQSIIQKYDGLWKRGA
jgi:hypothetical protein